ncbi:MAG: hypothetical protein RL380_1219 [Verrucomicrobiota bacterium]
MKTLRPLATAFIFLTAVLCVRAQDQTWVVESLSPQNEFTYDLQTGTATGTNGVFIKFGGATLIADRVNLNQNAGTALAEGHVRINREGQIWTGEHVNYNFKTGQMDTDTFRTGKSPVFATGEKLTADVKGNRYTAINGFITTDDVAEPALKIRARRLTVVPGKYIEARQCVLVLGGVPSFYLPYFRRNIGPHANNFNFTPGYRSRFGAFLLTRYDWYWNDALDGALHLDYRLKRGVGLGADERVHLGAWGDATFKYYYLHDLKPSNNANGVNIPDNRQRFAFSYLAHPYTNLSIRSQVRYQGDPLILRDFMEGEYAANRQPSTYVEVNKFWNNFSVDAVAQPRVNEFYQTLERLPDVRLTGYRQQIANTPIYYQSESSFAYLRQRYAISNDLPLLPNSDYSAARADTYHQLLIPQTFLGWLNVTPHAGARFTYYGEPHGDGVAASATPEVSRGILDTGIKTSFKTSRVWTDTHSKLFDMSGLRHVLEPSADYIFVPTPNRTPASITQFDTTLPSLRLQPIDFPALNSIDALDAQNILRLGIRNQLHTKRDGEIATLLDWSVFTDWRLDRPNNQPSLTPFSDIFSDLTFNPRTWLTFESQTRYDLDQHRFRLAYHTFTIQPNDTWSWGLGHYYVHDDPLLGTGNNLITSRLYYRLNENWGLQAGHNFESRNGKMQEQFYTLYRDFRSWTSALTFRVNENAQGADDFTIALTFSLKAMPRFGLGSDRVKPYSLFGE